MSIAAALRLKYDPSAVALYVTLREGDIAETVEIEEMVYLDLDHDARPLGIEFAAAGDILAFLERRGGEFVIPSRVHARKDVVAPGDDPSPPPSAGEVERGAVLSQLLGDADEDPRGVVRPVEKVAAKAAGQVGSGRGSQVRPARSH